MQSYVDAGFNNLLNYYELNREQRLEENVQDLVRRFALNRHFFKICSFEQDESKRRLRRPGLINRLKICPQPPDPPARQPNILETILKNVHDEGVIAAREICAASFASMASVCSTHPFDVLKGVYLEKQFRRTQKERVPWHKALFKSRLLKEIRLIATTKGWSRFYSGQMEAQREGLFQTISMFYTYQRVYLELSKFEHIFATYPDSCIFFSGFVSASFAVLLLRPYAAFQDRLSQKRELLRKFGPICSAYTLRHKLKWQQIFRGCFADFMYTGTQYGLRFLIFSKISDEILARKSDLNTNDDVDEYFRKDDSAAADFTPKRVEKTLTGGEALLAGALSGLFSDLFTHPMDVVNARLKMNALERHRFCYDETCRRYGQCMRLIWRTNKLKGTKNGVGFYPGFVPMLLKSSISTAVTFAVYDVVHQWLQLNLLD